MDQHDPDQPHDILPPAGPGPDQSARPGQSVGRISFRKPSSGGGRSGDGWAGGGASDGGPFNGTAAFHTVSVDGGTFRSGPPTTDAALRRYLLTRALGRSVINTVQWSGVAILLIAALCWLAGLKVLAVLIG